jgi:hypothetical protein
MSLRSSAVAAHRSPDTREVRRPYETALEDQYEAALIDLINLKRAGKPITPKNGPPPASGRPDGGIAPERGRRRRAKQGKLAKKPRKASPGQKEMLMSLEGEKPKVRPRRSRRRSHSDGPFRNRAVPRSLGSAQHWGGLHGYERSLGNDRSVRSCGRQGPPQESFPNDVGKGNGFSSLCDGLGRPVAEGNDRRAVALALGGLFIWSLGRS